MNKEKTRGWLGQLSIIKSLEQKFGERTMKERLSMTPGTPRFIARRLENEEDKVNAKDHEIYRSGVGTLQYLTKHSRPDISNPVRELSKTMDAPAPVHFKNVQAHQVCIVYQRLWTEIQTDQKYKKMGIEGTK